MVNKLGNNESTILSISDWGVNPRYDAPFCGIINDFDVHTQHNIK